MTVKQTPGLYTDERSQKQIAAFRAHEIVAAREYNRINQSRWNDEHRVQWELEHLGVVCNGDS